MLRNACDYVLQISFQKAQIAGLVSTLGKYIFRLGLIDTEKVRPKLWEYFERTAIEVTTSSSDVDEEKQFFPSKQRPKLRPTNKRLTERSISVSMRRMSNKRSTKLKEDEHQGSQKNKEKTKRQSTYGIKPRARTRVKEDVDPALRDMKLNCL